MEQVSLDEAYVDLTGTERLFGPVERTARAIQQRVQDELALSISVGLASNKLVAKVASDMEKPRGFTVVPPGTEAEFLAPLPVERLPGVGPVLLGQLRDRGVRTVGDLARVPSHLLSLSFGEWGRMLAHAARGEDRRRVEPQQTVKSISRETTFPEDVTDPEVLESTLVALTEDVSGGCAANTSSAHGHHQDTLLGLRDAYLLQNLERPRDVDEIFFQEVLSSSGRAAPAATISGCWGGGVQSGPRAWQDDLFDQQVPLLRELDLAGHHREKYGRQAVVRGATGDIRRSGPIAPDETDLGEGGIFPGFARVHRENGHPDRGDTHVARHCWLHLLVSHVVVQLDLLHVAV